MVKRKRNTLVAAADVATVTDNLDYMAQYPCQMLHTVDVHIVIAGCTLPVHSFVLMAASPFFSELISSHRSVPGNSLMTSPVEVPLQDVTEEALRAALAYLYMAMWPNRTSLVMKSFEQAKQLAQFGHKYHVVKLHIDADCFIRNWLRRGGFAEFRSIVEKGSSTDGRIVASATKTKQQALSVISITNFAEMYHLTRTLDCCATWLAENFSDISMVHHELPTLSADTNLAIMQLLSTLPAQKAVRSQVVHG